MMDWDGLNPDLLPLISKKLGDISNFIRFRAVCKKWRSSVGPRDCPPQLPCFIGDSFDRKFFSLYSSRAHTLHFTEAKVHFTEAEVKRKIRSTKQYIRMHDYSRDSTSLFNPITRSNFPIPKIENSTFSFPLCVVGDDDPNHASNKDLVVVHICRKENQGSDFMVFRQFSDGKLRNTFKVKMPYIPDSVSYFQRKLFVLNTTIKYTQVFDVTTGHKIFVIRSSCIRLHYLIDAYDELLGVAENYTNGKYHFEVYRLVEDGMNSYWVKMTGGIGDRMLFLSRSFVGDSICLKARDFDGLRGNCIYFASHNHYRLYRYDLESKETQVLSDNVLSRGIWFVPGLY